MSEVEVEDYEENQQLPQDDAKVADEQKKYATLPPSSPTTATKSQQNLPLP
jgi:hypothetical protein